MAWTDGIVVRQAWGPEEAHVGTCDILQMLPRCLREGDGFGDSRSWCSWVYPSQLWSPWIGSQPQVSLTVASFGDKAFKEVTEVKRGLTAILIKRKFRQRPTEDGWAWGMERRQPSKPRRTHRGNRTCWHLILDFSLHGCGKHPACDILWCSYASSRKPQGEHRCSLQLSVPKFLCSHSLVSLSDSLTSL